MKMVERSETPVEVGEERVISQETDKVLKNFSRDRSNLIPILQQVQEKLGYVPREAMLQVARHLDIPEIDVYAVVTFYNQFRLTPPGKHQIKVCLGTACHVKGGNTILECWERRLSIRAGETTPDRQFSVDRVACVGCCAMAPVSVVDEVVHGKISPTRVDGILLSFEMAKQKGDKQK